MGKGALSARNMTEATSKAIAGVHATTKTCESDFGAGRQINDTCKNLSDEANSGMVHARQDGICKLPSPKKIREEHIRNPKPRDLRVGILWRHPALTKALAARGRALIKQTKERQQTARKSRDDARNLRFAEKEEEEKKRLVRAAKDVRTYFEIDLCMTKQELTQRLTATKRDGAKVDLLREQIYGWTKGCQFSFPMIGKKIDMYSGDKGSDRWKKLKSQLEKIIDVIINPATAAQYQKPAEATAVFTSRTLALPRVGQVCPIRDELDAKDQQAAAEARDAAGQPDAEHEDLIQRYVGLKFWDDDRSHKEMMIVRIVTVVRDEVQWYQAECVKINGDGSVHEGHAVIEDEAKNQGEGFFGGMDPYVFDMDWIENDAENFDAMHKLYETKLAARAQRASRSTAQGQIRPPQMQGSRRSIRTQAQPVSAGS